ncbi:MAG: hypothetical protein CMF62_02425 [Magnetococcales bacterium]|nr:hypothetical protein [Magnetococcales bacterium]|tara:strand:- start:24530 stop:26131 length:1602 start_codon:yes stop_codon:yes gene_type:complete
MNIQQDILRLYEIDQPQLLKINKFNTMCTNILYMNYDYVNRIEVNRIMYDMIKTNKHIGKDTIKKIINDYTINIYDNLLKLKTEGKLTFDIFMKFSKRYFIMTDKFKVFMENWDWEKNFIQNTSEKSFYNNILSQKLDIFNYFGSYFIDNKTEINKLTILYSIANYFKKYDDENKLFLQLGTKIEQNKENIKSIISYFNTMIVNNDSIDNINTILNIANSFTNRTIFDTYYFTMFKNRIMDKTSDLELEQNILKKFQTNKNIEIVNQMKNMLTNVQSIRTSYKELYENVEVEATSTENSGFTTSIGDPLRKKINAEVYNNFYWDNIPHDTITYNIPLKIRPYFAMHKSLFKTLVPNHDIAWNLNFGSVILKLTFGIKSYNLELTIPQYIVLSLFENNKSSSLEYIKIVTNIPKNKIKQLINGFIRSNLIIETIPNVFVLNEYFNHKSENISFKSLMKVDLKTIANVILYAISKNEKMNYSSILEHVNSKFDISEELIKKSLDILVKQHILSYEDTYYKEIIDESDSDDFTDSD